MVRPNACARDRVQAHQKLTALEELRLTERQKRRLCQAFQYRNIPFVKRHGLRRENFH